jgi:hypothetical protein
MTSHYLLLTAQFDVSNTAYPENVLTRKKTTTGSQQRQARLSKTGITG